MASLKALVFGLLLLVSQALASRVVFLGRFADPTKPDQVKKPSRTTKSLQMPDDKASQAMARMKAWSNNKYQANPGDHNTVQISNVALAKTRPEATKMVEEMQAIVNKNYKAGDKTIKDRFTVGRKQLQHAVKSGIKKTTKAILPAKKNTNTLQRPKLRRRWERQAIEWEA
ncbi:unnamed protein product [Clonostachys rosea f. rosea IK726]|uniref:Uncharacterized protein n=1 Tax=Clonostachys rosea f. rosea IK726 TaxID=1349383 RepID=A0ACA9U2S4_BIOOC|nr:unnamed protein product [Clonostachys rosea f. rosea IK726]